MLCENCNQNEATVHYTEITDGVKTEHHLCSECAKKINLDYYTPFAKLLTGLLGASGTIAREEDSTMAHVKCPKCGMSYAEFTQVGKFGCSECYNVFGPLIEEHLKKLHGNIENTGKKYKNVKDDTIEIIVDKDNKKPRTKKPNDKEINILQAKLQEAIALENYEDAAKYRDEIKLIKEGKGEDA